MLVKSKKELYELLPLELQSSKAKKVIGKMFSIGASNLWSIDYENLILTFKFENDLVKVVGQLSVVYIKEVSEIPMRKLTFKQSGLEVDVMYLGRYTNLLTKDNTIITTGVNDYNSIVQVCNANKRSDIICTSQSISTLYNNIVNNNRDCFIELEYNEFGSYGGLLCIKDCSVFTKGMIFRPTDNGNYRLKQSPLKLFNERYGNIYNDITCDLGSIKLEDLEKVNTKYFSCSKQKFGCQYGCTSSCSSDNANYRDAKNKETLIALWHKCFK